MSTFRSVRIFALPSGNLSWRYADNKILSPGEIVPAGYYICSECRSLINMSIPAEDKQLEVCAACTPPNSAV